MAGALILSFYQWIFSQLISTSNINFETYKVLELNIFSLAGFVSLFLFLLVPLLWFIKIFRNEEEYSPGTIILSVLLPQ